jgi:anti-sigma factor RsiW
MTLTCAESEEHLLESFDGALPDDLRRVVEDHVATCAGCTAFALSLRAVDAQLTTALPPALPPASLADEVRARIRRERRVAIRESLPDLIHLTGCSVTTLLSAALLPIEASVTIAAGVGFTCVTYVFMAVMRWSIEAVEQPDL